MRRAVALTRPGTTWPNPSVGCVIVQDDDVVGEGTTGEGGRPHAEEIALAMAGERARGATAYVTLEPCGQRSIGTPSCSEKLVEAGVARVVFACADPSPYASHIGVERMQAAGITVEQGLLAAEAEHLIAPTAHYHATGRPLVEASESAAGFDAEFTPASDDLTAELAAWAGRGYRHLYVKPASELAMKLDELGYLPE
jgi:pyrimidine deaminase RibD-like protein